MRYFGKRGELRIYSGVTSNGSAGDLFFFSVAFVNMDFTGPEKRPRPEEVVVLDRNLVDGNAHHVQGSDDVIVNPVQITFTADLDDTVNRRSLRDALGNMDRRDPWTVNGVSFANTNGTSTLINGFGSTVSVPSPFDPVQDRVDVEVVWTGSTGDGSDDIGRNYDEVWFAWDQVQIRESDTAVQIAATGFCYGNISTILSFSPGSGV